MKSDCHMHTNFSSDAPKSSTPEVMIQKALEKGLERICFTDHYDKDYPFESTNGVLDESAFIFDPEQYFKILCPLKEKYEGRIEVRIGIELGLQTHLGEFYRRLTELYPFDFVIGSAHVFAGKDPYYNCHVQDADDEQEYRNAFVEMLEYVKAVDAFDSLGHLDYVVRYGKEKALHYSYRAFADEIDEILKCIIAKGKALEFNTAGLKYGLGFAHPHPDVLKRYRELGGELLTVGADGHKPEHIGYAYDQADGILKACGFRYYTEFKERKPQFIKIL